MNKKINKINKQAVAIIVAFIAIAAIMIFGYNAVIRVLAAMGSVRIGSVPFLVEGGLIVAIWASLAITYVVLGRATNFFRKHRTSVVPVVVATSVTFLLVVSWILRPQEIAAASAMAKFRYENPLVFFVLNFAGATCIGCAIGTGIGYHFFGKKVVIFENEIRAHQSDEDNNSTEPNEQPLLQDNAKVFYDKKTEQERKESKYRTI